MIKCVTALVLLTSVMPGACGGSSDEAPPDDIGGDGAVVETPVTDPPQGSASAYDVNVSPPSGTSGTTVTVTAALPPYCLQAPGRIAVTFADEDLQHSARTGSGKRVPHEVTGTVLRASYTVVPADSTGDALFVISCSGGADGLGVLHIGP